MHNVTSELSNECKCLMATSFHHCWMVTDAGHANFQYSAMLCNATMYVGVCLSLNTILCISLYLNFGGESTREKRNLADIFWMELKCGSRKVTVPHTN